MILGQALTYSLTHSVSIAVNKMAVGCTLFGPRCP